MQYDFYPFSVKAHLFYVSVIISLFHYLCQSLSLTGNHDKFDKDLSVDGDEMRWTFADSVLLVESYRAEPKNYDNFMSYFACMARQEILHLMK